jgi:hypothetical protein
VDHGEFDITIDPTVLQDDFYRDHEVESCSSGEEEGLDDDPSCDYVEDLRDKSDLKARSSGKSSVCAKWFFGIVPFVFNKVLV